MNAIFMHCLDISLCILHCVFLLFLALSKLLAVRGKIALRENVEKSGVPGSK